MTAGSQPSALAAAVNPGLSSEHAVAAQVRNATLTPFAGACGSALVAGMVVGSVSRVESCAVARATPVLPALLAGAVDSEPPWEAGAEVFAEVDDEELHADATATQAVTRMPKQAFLSFIAMSPLRGRRARSRDSRRPGSTDRRSITPSGFGRQEVPYHDYDENYRYEERRQVTRAGARLPSRRGDRRERGAGTPKGAPDTAGTRGGRRHARRPRRHARRPRRHARGPPGTREGRRAAGWLGGARN